MQSNPIDVWLMFDNETDEESSHEANTYTTELGYRVDWCNSAVGLISSVEFETLADAYDWLESAGYQNYSS